MTTGAIALAISEAAGPQLQEECTEYINQNGPMRVSREWSISYCKLPGSPGKSPRFKLLHGSDKLFDCMTSVVSLLII